MLPGMMMTPGFFGAGGAPTPFSFSGTWGSSLEGWSNGPRFNDGGGFERTSPGVILIESTPSTINYVLPASVGGGLRITASVWHRHWAGGATTRSLKYSIGGGSFTTLASVTNSTTTYAQFSGQFDNPGDDDVTIRVESSGSIMLDDWAISGVLIP